MNAVSRSVDIPPPRRGRRELNEDTGVRLGLHIKSAEQAMMAAKTEALRSFGLTVAQYAAMLSLYYVPEQSSAQLARAAAVTPSGNHRFAYPRAAMARYSSTPSGVTAQPATGVSSLVTAAITVPDSSSRAVKF